MPAIIPFFIMEMLIGLARVDKASAGSDADNAETIDAGITSEGLSEV